jgi:hypothetical protein
MTNTTTFLVLAALSLGGAAAGGCVIAPAGPPVYPTMASSGAGPGGCQTFAMSASYDARWHQAGLATDTDQRIIGQRITAYRVRWFSGQWSQWYTPGQDDQDSKTNADGSPRRMWSYFDDHAFEYELCGDAQAGAIEPAPAAPAAGSVTVVDHRGAAAPACTTTQRAATGDDRWWQAGLALDADARLLGTKIRRYRLQWFSGQWSGWFVPGQNDVDTKVNADGSVRRMWSYFDDHTFEYEVCP